MKEGKAAFDEVIKILRDLAGTPGDSSRRSIAADQLSPSKQRDSIALSVGKNLLGKIEASPSTNGRKSVQGRTSTMRQSFTGNNMEEAAKVQKSLTSRKMNRADNPRVPLVVVDLKLNSACSDLLFKDLNEKGEQNKNA